jgi:hypothetical protein
MNAASIVGLIVLAGLVLLCALAFKAVRDWRREQDTEVPCPKPWPDCAPDGCSNCDGKGYTARDAEHRVRDLVREHQAAELRKAKAEAAELRAAKSLPGLLDLPYTGAELRRAAQAPSLIADKASAVSRELHAIGAKYGMRPVLRDTEEPGRVLVDWEPRRPELLSEHFAREVRDRLAAALAAEGCPPKLALPGRGRYPWETATEEQIQADLQALGAAVMPELKEQHRLALLAEKRAAQPSHRLDPRRKWGRPALKRHGNDHRARWLDAGRDLYVAQRAPLLHLGCLLLVCFLQACGGAAAPESGASSAPAVLTSVDMGGAGGALEACSSDLEKLHFVIDPETFDPTEIERLTYVIDALAKKYGVAPTVTVQHEGANVVGDLGPMHFREGCTPSGSPACVVHFENDCEAVLLYPRAMPIGELQRYWDTILHDRISYGFREGEPADAPGSTASDAGHEITAADLELGCDGSRFPYVLPDGYCAEIKGNFQQSAVLVDRCQFETGAACGDPDVGTERTSKVTNLHGFPVVRWVHVPAGCGYHWTLTLHAGGCQ